MTDDFEDELRATMRDHDHEAPTGALTPGADQRNEPRMATGGRYTWLPIAAAAAAVATLVGITLALGGGSNRGAPTAASLAAPTCPGTFVASRSQPWVPARPSGVDGTARLVPDRTPTRVLVCAYLHGDNGALTGKRELAELAPATDTLAWEPKGPPRTNTCTLNLAMTDGDNFLIALKYGAATVWVSAPGNHCVGSSNGVFDSPANLRSWANSSYLIGRWANDAQIIGPTGGPCAQDTAGRLGQDTAMVPGAPRSLAICTESGAPLAEAPRTVTGFRALVTALNALPLGRSTALNGCDPVTYVLQFGYATGPPLTVRVTPACDPGVDNGSRHAIVPPEIRQRIIALLSHK